MYALDESITQIYIGSTKCLFDRQTRCKNKVKDLKVTDHKHQFIRDNGGFNAWGWKVLETGIYDTDLDSLVREQYWIQLYQPELNSNRAFASAEWKKEQIIVKNKKHNDKPENIEKRKIYADANRDINNAKRRAKAAAKKALLLQPDLSVVDEPISPHAESVH